MSRTRESESTTPAGVELKLALNAATLPEGSPLRIEATWTNRTGRRIVVWHIDDLHAWVFRFGSGWKAEFHDLPPPSPPQPRVLEPDASYMQVATLDAHVRFRHKSGQLRRHLPPGAYTLTVALALQKVDPTMADAHAEDVMSAPATFTVMPRAGLLFERPQLSFGAESGAAYKKVRDHLAMLLATVTQEPRVLPVLVHQARHLTAMGAVIDVPARELLETLHLGADAGAACFGGRQDDGQRIARIGGTDVAFTVPQWPTGGRDLLWLHAFELAEISRNTEARAVLLSVPLAELTGGVATARARYLDAVYTVARGEDARSALQALAAVTGPDAGKSATRAVVLEALVREDLPAFDSGLLELLTLFRNEQFQPEASIGPEALLCFEAMSLARQADERGLPVGIVSEFIPARLLKKTD